MIKTLVRPKNNRVLFGVCQGLGEYFDIDPVIFRILFIVFTISGGAGIILYILGIFLIPDENADDIKKEAEDIKKNRQNIRDKAHQRTETVAEEIRTTFHRDHRQNSSAVVFGLIILLVGVIFLANNFFPWFSFSKLWPLIFIALGILILADSQKGK